MTPNQHSTLGAGRTAQPRDLSARLEYLRNPEVRLELGDAAWTAQRAALVDELAAQYEEIAVRADERLKMLNEYATDLATAVEEKRGLQEQLETCRGLLKQALDENIRLRVALEKTRDHRSPDGSQLISGRGAEAIASAALQTSGGAGMAVPSDLSRAPVAGATPPVSNPATKPYVRPADDPHTLVAKALTPDPASEPKR